jgi:hypothetical protein
MTLEMKISPHREKAARDGVLRMHAQAAKGSSDEYRHPPLQ